MRKEIMLSYSKLWKLMIEKEINKTQLANCAIDRTVLRSKTDAERSERTL